MSLRDGRKRTPIVDPQVEAASRGSGEVKSWVMSPEELEDYRARTGYKAPTNQDGEKMNPPMNLPTEKVVVQSKPSALEPDKKKFLELIAAGGSIASAERALGIRTNGMYYWLKKWNLVGLKPDKARELLGIADQPSKQVDPKATSSAVEKQLRADLDTVVQSANKNSEIAVLAQRELVKAKDEIRQLRDRIAVYVSDLARLTQQDAESKLRIKELQEDRDQWKQQVAQFKGVASTFGLSLQEAHQAIKELEEERLLLLSALESAAEDAAESIFVEAPAVDNVNQPSHYTIGGIETIDCIASVVNGYAGIDAVCAGNAVKYLARAPFKGKLVEDLEKANWYVNRLISSVDQAIRDTV